MSNTVLFVDDEENILNSVSRLFADDDMRILRASNAGEALDFFKKQEIAVVVSDNHMHGMDGLDFLTKTIEISPDTLKILMTGYTDLATAVDAMNRGKVFRFIIKPWEDDVLRLTVHEALKRYQLIQSLKKEDEATLFSLAQTIELKDHYTRGHCASVARYALMMAEALNLPEKTKKDLKYGSWLHDCGKIGVPERILNKNGPLDVEEFEIIKNHPRWGADVARQARLPDAVVNIILHHHEKFDGSGYPAGIKEEDISVEARIVTVADVFDAMTSDRPYRKRLGKKKAIEILVLMRGNV